MHSFIFECLGFSSNPVFIKKDNRYYHVAVVYCRSNCPEVFMFLDKDYTGIIPKESDIIREYNLQLSEKGVYINPEIRKAG